jgi:O-antigen ligase
MSAITERVGLYASGLFALGAWLAPAAMYLGFYLLILAAVLQPAFWRALARERLAQVALVLVVYLGASATWASLEFPETRPEQWGELGDWLKLFAFFPLAWWLRGDERRVGAVLLLAAGGWLLGVVAHADLGALVTFDPGPRTGFRHAILFSGLLSATVLLGLVLLSSRLLAPSSALGLRLLGAGGWVVGLWVSAYALLASRARAAWLSALLILPLWTLIRFVGVRKSGGAGRASAVLGGVVVVALSGLLVANLSAIQKRLATDAGVASAIVQGETRDLPESSLAHRYQMLRYGFERWRERPLLGWGTGSVGWLLSTRAPPELQVRKDDGRLGWHAHFHNTYVEIAVRFGVVGVALFGWLVGALAWAVRRAHARGEVPRDLMLFLSGALALFLLYCLTNFSVLRADTRVYWVLLAAAGYGFCLRPAAVAGRDGPDRASA